MAYFSYKSYLRGKKSFRRSAFKRLSGRMPATKYDILAKETIRSSPITGKAMTVSKAIFEPIGGSSKSLVAVSGWGEMSLEQAMGLTSALQKPKSVGSQFGVMTTGYGGLPVGQGRGLTRLPEQIRRMLMQEGSALGIPDKEKEGGVGSLIGLSVAGYLVWKFLF